MISEVQDPVYACQGDSLTLQCNASSTINVILGEHGLYVDPCDSECCEPNQFDCAQVMEQNNATEWEYLKVYNYSRYSLHNQNNDKIGQATIPIMGAGRMIFRGVHPIILEGCRKTFPRRFTYFLCLNIFRAV